MYKMCQPRTGRKNAAEAPAGDQNQVPNTQSLGDAGAISSKLMQFFHETRMIPVTVYLRQQAAVFADLRRGVERTSSHEAATRSRAASMSG
jgi:hypothetical protein